MYYCFNILFWIWLCSELHTSRSKTILHENNVWNIPGEIMDGLDAMIPLGRLRKNRERTSSSDKSSGLQVLRLYFNGFVSLGSYSCFGFICVLFFFLLKFILTWCSSTAVFYSVSCSFAERAAALLVKGSREFSFSDAKFSYHLRSTILVVVLVQIWAKPKQELWKGRSSKQ